MRALWTHLDSANNAKLMVSLCLDISFSNFFDLSALRGHARVSSVASVGVILWRFWPDDFAGRTIATHARTRAPTLRMPTGDPRLPA